MYKLLIVDDKEIFCRAIMRLPYFQEGNPKFSIAHTAKNGVEALEYLRGAPVDVTLTDIRMPLMDGIELLKNIQKEHLCRCTVLISEYAEFSYAKEGIINGAFDYLVKPVDNATIQSTFDRIFDALQQESASGIMESKELDALLRCILGRSEDSLSSVLEAAVSYIRQHSARGREAVICVEQALRRIQAGVGEAYPYAWLYLPLKQLCTLPPDIPGADEATGFLARTAVILHGELKKFVLSSQHPLVRDVWNYTLLHIEKSCRLQALAERFYVNKNYLSTLFKKESGIYYKDFVSRFKIERAKLLLAYSGLKVYNIAEVLCFSDAEYFGRVFKAQVGLPPSEFSYDAYLDAQLARCTDSLRNGLIWRYYGSQGV